jgi:hypothetical protein
LAGGEGADVVHESEISGRRGLPDAFKAERPDRAQGEIVIEPHYNHGIDVERIHEHPDFRDSLSRP